VQAKDTKINSGARVGFDTAKRRVDSSSSTNTDFNERGKKKQGKCGRKKSEAQVI